jgi:carbon monoxide dehydrogenase subunit G
MEKITDSFRVDTPLDATWRTLLDVERIAPCMPGAQLQEIEGDEFRGIVKVKVGPITAQYKGAARLTNVDEGTHHLTIEASGRDTRGNGNASATVLVAMRDDNGGTHVEIETDLNVTGKVAQFGRGIMADVSAKLLKQFVDNLESNVLGGVDHAAGAAVTDAAETAATTPTEIATGTTPEANAPVATTASSASSGPRRVDHPEPEAVDLVDTAGGAVAKRLLPIVALVLGALLFRSLRRRRRRNRA